MSPQVTQLLESFNQNRRENGRQLALLLEKDPAVFQQSVVHYMLNGADESSVQYLVWLLESNGMLVDLVMDPEISSVDEAVAVVKAMRGKFERLDVDLAKKLKTAPEDLKSRVLRLLAETAQNNRTLPLLIHALREASADIRAKAGLIFAQHCQNELFIENVLKDPDPRVRAAAMDGLGFRSSKELPSILLTAVSDSSPDVKAHAVLAAHRLGDSRAPQWMNDLAKHPLADFRVRAAWVLGETEDPNWLPVLQKLEKDPDSRVPAEAEKAIRKIEAAHSVDAVPDQARPDPEAVPAEEPQSLEQELQVLHAAVDLNGERCLHLAITDPEGTNVEALSARHFAIREGDHAIGDFDLLSTEERGPMNLMYVLDCSGSMSATQLQDSIAAVVFSLKNKAPDDRVGVYKYSLDVERSVRFTTDPRHCAALVRRRHAGLRSASRIHDAIGRAAEELVAQNNGSRSIIAIADGDDRGSERSLSDLIGELRAGRVPVSIVEFNETPTSTTLRDLAQQSGGQYVHASRAREVTRAVQSVVRCFSNRYTILYRCDAPPAEEVRVVLKSPHGAGEASGMLFSDQPDSSPDASRPQP